jgi:hypothetical protein
MSERTKRQNLSEEEIDRVVGAQADDDSAWEEPIQVGRRKASSVSIPAGLAARAAFLARLHREADVEKWLMRVIRERVELEEAAFREVKRDLTVKNSK